MGRKKEKRQALHDALIKHVLPLCGHHVSINELDKVLYNIVDEFNQPESVEVKTAEGLVNEIIVIMDAKSDEYRANRTLPKSRFESVAREIASIIPLNAELFKALKDSTIMLNFIIELFGDDMTLSTKFGATQQIKENEAILNAKTTG